MGQLLSCYRSEALSPTAHTTRQRGSSTAAPAAAPPRPPTQPAPAPTATAPIEFPFTMVLWIANQVRHTFTETTDPALYNEFRNVARGLAYHSQYIDIITKILETFHFLLDPSLRPHPSPPSSADVAQYLQRSFPDLRVWDQLDDAWGMVDKADSTNAIYLSEYVVRDAERFLSQPWNVAPVPRAGHKILTLITLAHELVHATTKAFFGANITPRGLGPESGGYGEAGWEGEGQLFGGYLLIEWSGGFPAFQMDKINGFFLEEPATGRQFYIDPTVIVRWSADLVQALDSNTNFPPPPVNFSTATPAPPPAPGYTRQRIATNERLSPPPSPLRASSSTSSSVGTGPRYPLVGGPWRGDPMKRTRGRSSGYTFPDTPK